MSLFLRASRGLIASRNAVLANQALGMRSASSVFNQQRSLSGKPTLAQAKSLNVKVASMENEQLVQLAYLGMNEAEEELLVRHIMSVDEIEYDQAREKFNEIEAYARKGLYLVTLPYKAGIVAAVSTGILSIPLVFSYDIAHTFNELYVTTDVPEAEDVETFLEVGSWTWGWMEPVLGTASFTLIAMQFARAQMLNLGIKPFTSFVKHRNGMKLVKRYPQYDPVILLEYGKDVDYYKDGHYNSKTV
eukprot:Awhi_evm1s2631